MNSTTDAAVEAPTSHMVPEALRSDTEYGLLTHIERINGPTLQDGGNPADGPDQAPAPRDPDAPDAQPQPYRLLATSFVGGILRKAGELVFLLPHEVADHHVPVEQPADPPADPAPRRSRRAAPAEAEAAPAKPPAAPAPAGKDS